MLRRFDARQPGDWPQGEANTSELCEGATSSAARVTPTMLAAICEAVTRPSMWGIYKAG
jgi:hypothetical protein